MHERAVRGPLACRSSRPGEAYIERHLFCKLLIMASHFSISLMPPSTSHSLFFVLLSPYIRLLSRFPSVSIRVLNNNSANDWHFFSFSLLTNLSLYFSRIPSLSLSPGLVSHFLRLGRQFMYERMLKTEAAGAAMSRVNQNFASSKQESISKSNCVKGRPLVSEWLVGRIGHKSACPNLTTTSPPEDLFRLPED